jgi:hypothetical protein
MSQRPPKPQHGQQWTDREARDVLARLDRSEVQHRGLCPIAGVSIHRIRYWRARLAAMSQPAATPAPDAVKLRSNQTLTTAVTLPPMGPIGSTHQPRSPPGVGVPCSPGAPAIRAYPPIPPAPPGLHAEAPPAPGVPPPEPRLVPPAPIPPADPPEPAAPLEPLVPVPPLPATIAHPAMLTVAELLVRSTP